MSTATAELVTFKMLDISTAHLTTQTRAQMEQQNAEGVLFYPKGPWGWFTYVPSLADELTVGDEAPADLKQCIEFAQRRGFDWIVFDCDGAVITDLPLYEEVELPDQAETAAARVLAASYGRHLQSSLRCGVATAVGSDGNILVSAGGSQTMQVSPSFAQAMVMQALPVKDLV